MPFDGNPPDVLDDAIVLLVRARDRVKAGYTGSSFYRKDIFGRPRYCMSGALTHDDDGKWEATAYCLPQFKLAESIVREVIGGKSLVSYGTNPFAKFFVLRAYNRAIKLALSRQKENLGGTLKPNNRC